MKFEEISVKLDKFEIYTYPTIHLEVTCFLQVREMMQKLNNAAIALC